MPQTYSVSWLTRQFEKGEIPKFLFFWGQNTKPKDSVNSSCFSQWFESPFSIAGVIYKTTEHWMMAQKALLFDNYEIHQQILECDSPGEAKDLGRRVTGFDHTSWENKRYEIVKIGNIHKFNQHREMGNFLLASKNRVLVESSPVDTIWGIGLTKDSIDAANPYQWRGLNLLGFALMEVRDFLQEQGFFESDFGFLPPWMHHPEMDGEDMFWRMGKGEECLAEFSKKWEVLSKPEKQRFQVCYPDPKIWDGFYLEE